MDIDLVSPAPEPYQSLPAPADHPEFFPQTSYGDLLPPQARQEKEPLIKLETRGVTSHLKQTELFNTRLLHKSTLVLKLRSVGAEDLAETLEACHAKQSWAQCTNCARVKTFWNRCENFFCPCCQPMLARDRVDTIRWWARQVDQPKHLILTARNTDQITFTRVKVFKQAISKLRRSACARGWRGGTWSLEVTNEGRGWHLHAHMLIDAYWLDMPAISRRWADLMGQDFAICRCKDVREMSYLQEVTKYAVKGSQLASWSGLDIVCFINAFKGQRSFGVFGSLYGKRSQWAEHLKTLRGDRSKCECGCNAWKLYQGDEWEAHLIALDRQSTTTIQPRQAQRENPQLALRLPLNLRTIRAVAR